jgi:phosphoribosylformylglycinamidine cyclo-ligase
MGIGIVLAVAPAQVAAVQERLQDAGMVSYQLGQLQSRPADEEKIVIK